MCAKKNVLFNKVRSQKIRSNKIDPLDNNIQSKRKKEIQICKINFKAKTNSFNMIKGPLTFAKVVTKGKCMCSKTPVWKFIQILIK